MKIFIFSRKHEHLKKKATEIYKIYKNYDKTYKEIIQNF